MDKRNQGRIEWLKSQAHKFKQKGTDSEGWLLNTPETELLKMINVQTALIDDLAESLAQLQTQHDTEHETLCKFMAKEGFNYPDNVYKCKD
jgi:hypothetical protein